MNDGGCGLGIKYVQRKLGPIDADIRESKNVLNLVSEISPDHPAIDGLKSYIANLEEKKQMWAAAKERLEGICKADQHIHY